MYTVGMLRTQIYIPKEIHEKLWRLSELHGESIAKIIRDFIELGIQKINDPTGKATLRAIAKLNIKGGPSDLSSRLDWYLYDKPKTRYGTARHTIR